MTHICLKCHQQSDNLNLWCDQPGCPVNQMPRLLQYGEWAGEIEIVSPLTILPTAAIYKAQQQEIPIFLKVAHPGFENRLKREALFLQQFNGHHPALPTLLPAYQQATIAKYPYGRFTLDQEQRYFMVFAQSPGTLLSDLLSYNSQPWYQHAGWIILILADLLSLIHKQGKYHFGLHPQNILVHHDKKNVPRPLLLDLGLLSSSQRQLGGQIGRQLSAGYIAPELLVSTIGRSGSHTDVYSLGLLLYEMLAGCSAYPDLNQDAAIAAVRTGSIPSLNRRDLGELPNICLKAIQKQPKRRYADMISFYEALRRHLPPVPRPVNERIISWKMILVVIGALLVISLLLLLALMP